MSEVTTIPNIQTCYHWMHRFDRPTAPATYSLNILTIAWRELELCGGCLSTVLETNSVTRHTMFVVSKHGSIIWQTTQNEEEITSKSRPSKSRHDICDVCGCLVAQPQGHHYDEDNRCLEWVRCATHWNGVLTGRLSHDRYWDPSIQDWIEERREE